MTNNFRTPVYAFAVFVLPVLFLNCASENFKPINYLDQKAPGLTAEVFAPGVVTTDFFEHSAPAFSPDGSVVLWTVVNKHYRAYLLEMKYQNGKWSAPARPSFADSTADDYYPSFSPDGEKLYFSSRRKLPGDHENGDIRIWEVERIQDEWKNPVPFDTTVSRGHEFAHSISRNGTLYFSTSLGGGANWNILKSERVNNAYLKPVLLPYSINSVNFEDGVFIAPDESFLIFDSQRPEGIGGSIDLYISFRNRNKGWSIPVNMGSKINSAFSERFVKLSPDGKYLFFGSNRNQSDKNWGFDIYWIDARVLDELRPVESEENSIQQPMGDEIINALFKNEKEAVGSLFHQWLAVHPKSLDATLNYSSVLRNQGQLLAAEKLLDNDQWSENVNIVMEKSLVMFGLNNDEEADRLLSPILVEGDQLRERYIYLSMSLLEMRRIKKSDEYFEKAMTIFPSSFPYYNRAASLARVGEKDRAFEALNKAIDHKGYNVKQAYEDDSSFDSLKKDKRWKILMKRMD